MKQQFFKCGKCGKIVALVKPASPTVSCCEEGISAIEPNTTDAAQEKHVPTYEVKDNIVTVKVGSAAHPMGADHFIEWISLQTKEGNQRKLLAPDTKPEAQFALLPGDEVEAVFAYCNLHGLWKC